MECFEIILSILYLVVGLMCSINWFKEDYEEEYQKALEDGSEDAKGMSSLVMLVMTLAWPIIFVYKTIKAL
jgi:hypothetical protein